VLKEKRRLYYSLDGMGISYVRSDTNFVLMDVKKDSRKVFEAMLKEGIIVRDMRAYGLQNYIRVTVGKPPENRKFLSALKKVLQGKGE